MQARRQPAQPRCRAPERPQRGRVKRNETSDGTSASLGFAGKAMKTTASDVLVETLLAWGVDTVFGIPGDGINGIIEAFRKRQDKIRFIQVRHEEAAAFAACGYAKFTGRLGVCFATSGPGAIHLLNGLYHAKIGTYFQQEIDILALFNDVATYNHMILGAKHGHELVDIACRSALSTR